MPTATRLLLPQAILRVAAVRAVEARHLASAEPPLMERAGAAAARLAGSLLAERRGCTLVLCGPGNNGGDGFVVARLLRAAGHPVRVVFAADAARLPADAAAARAAYLAAGGDCQEAPPETPADVALAIDALFGIGLARPIEGPYASWIARVNGWATPLLALDIPSGLDADTGARLGATVRATHTATFIALKPGLLTLDGPDHCGELSVHDLDLPLDAASEVQGCTLAPSLFAVHLHRRLRNSHKGMSGDAGIIGGAAGMLGAAFLAGRAALKLGAGRVFVGLLAESAPALDALQPELMLRPPHEVMERASALALGPGLGQSEVALDLARTAVARDVPLLLDADALNLVATHRVLAGQLARRSRPAVLTPHPAEAARLLGLTTAEVQKDRLAAALEIARRLRAHVVLKGCGSIVADPDGHWRINTSGNPGMAAAGMGDVLSGMVVALLAQGWPEGAALAAGVHLHGLAADRLVAAGQGPVGLAAGELIDAGRAEFNRWIATSHA